MTRLGAFLGSLILIGTFAGPAQATPILEQTLIATGGDVVVTFVSNGAAMASELWLDGDAGDELGAIFNNWTTAIGTSMNLGSFAEGTELVFKLLVEQTGDVFYTGPAARNPDGLVHAVLESATGKVLVGFEDLFGGGDLDYDDLVFAFTNVTPTDSSATTGGAGTTGGGGEGTTVPVSADEPGTLVMLGGGLSMLVFAMKRRRAV
jgi:hypothetical protein